MNKKCQGFGVILQDENIKNEGYTTNIENEICQRCFRMKNYGEYQVSTRSNDEYIEILKTVGKTNDLVLHIVDLLNIDKDINLIRNYISNKMILVLNKRDALPKSTNDDKIISYIKSLGATYEDIIIISANKNYNIDLLMDKIRKYKTSNKVYVVGHTNTGKSSLINKLISDYTDNESKLTISPLPSTTLNTVAIILDKDLILVDTPGLVDRGNIANYIGSNTLKKLIHKKEIKPRTFQIKKGQCLVIDDICRIDYQSGDRNSFTLYIPNSLKVKKMNALRQNVMKDLAKNTYEIKYREDLVINGLGWIKMVGNGVIDVYIDKNIETFIRKNLI